MSDIEAPAAKPIEGEEARPEKARPFSRLSYTTKVSIVTFVSLLAVWQLAAWLEVVSPVFLPSPAAVAQKFYVVSTDGFQGVTLWGHLLISAARVFTALAFAVTFGVALGLGISLSQTLQGIFEPIIEFYRPIPPLAYLPLVVIWFGIGEFAKILVITLSIFPSIVIATVDGLKSISQDKVNAARSMGASRLQVVTLVLLPHALPSILTGTRIGLGIGWSTLVAAELIAATSGLGFMVKGAADFLVTDVVILGILVIAAVSIGMELLLRALQKTIVPWQGHE